MSDDIDWDDTADPDDSGDEEYGQSVQELVRMRIAGEDASGNKVYPPAQVFGDKDGTPTVLLFDPTSGVLLVDASGTTVPVDASGATVPVAETDKTGYEVNLVASSLLELDNYGGLYVVRTDGYQLHMGNYFNT